eukprot:RCo043161
MAIALAERRVQVGRDCIPPGRWPDELSNPKLCGTKNCLHCAFDLVGCDVENVTRDGRDVVNRTKSPLSIPHWWNTGVSAWRTVTTDYVFRMTRRFVLKYACRIRTRLFGVAGVPANTILVHIRWGDKLGEMELAPISEYIRAVDQIVQRHGILNATTLVVTEDPSAWAAFQKEKRAE